MGRYGTFWVDTAGEKQKLFDKEIARRLLGFTQGYGAWVWFAILAAPLVSAVQLARPYLLKLAVDEAIVPGDLAALKLYAGLFLVVLLAELVTMYGQLVLLQWIGQVVLMRMRETLYRKVLRLDHDYYHKTATGTILTRLTNDLEAIQELFASGIVTLVTDFLKLLGIMGVMLWMNWRLALIIFAVLPPLYFISDWFRRRLRVAYRKVRNGMARLNAQLSATVDGIEEIQALELEEDLRKRFRESNGRYRDANLESILNDALLYAIVEMLASVVIGMLLWFGGRQYLDGGITLGVLIAFVEYVQMFFVPIRDLSSKYAVLQSAFASGEKVLGLLDEPVGIVPPNEPADPEPTGSAALDGIEFSYVSGTPVLQGIDIDVPPRRFVALVGPTGHGKTTVLRLLRRFYDVDAGTVQVDGTDVRDFDLADLRRRVLTVEQRSFLFSGTVRENLQLTDTIDEATLRRVVADVGFGNARADLDAFLNTPIQEGGRNLSLGEQQLISLARVLVRDPEILLLDEATAHVDSATEASIYRVLRSEHGQRTMIAVAHRLSTIREADEILLVRHNRIEERGTHEELIQQSGIYANLIRLHEQEGQLHDV